MYTFEDYAFVGILLAIPTFDYYAFAYRLAQNICDVPKCFARSSTLHTLHWNSPLQMAKKAMKRTNSFIAILTYSLFTDEQ